MHYHSGCFNKSITNILRLCVFCPLCRVIFFKHLFVLATHKYCIVILIQLDVGIKSVKYSLFIYLFLIYFLKAFLHFAFISRRKWDLFLGYAR